MFNKKSNKELLNYQSNILYLLINNLSPSIYYYIIVMSKYTFVLISRTNKLSYVLGN